MGEKKKTLIPKKTYIKLLIILCFLAIFLLPKLPEMKNIWLQELSTQQKLEALWVEAFNLEVIEPSQPRVDLDVALEEYANQHSNQPHLASQESIQQANYQFASQVADRFNQSINPEALNHEFERLVQEAQGEYAQLPLQTGIYLQDGSQLRAQQLADYQYLASHTIDGGHFVSLYPLVGEAEYRLAENLYELYISAYDIHLQTWENPEVLASYLFQSMSESLDVETLDAYRHQYLAIHASPSEVAVESSPYVRLVAVWVLDTE